METLVWVLIYSGLLIGSLGLFLRAAQPAWGLALIGLGLADAAVGVLLIWLRSRLPEPISTDTKDSR